jgi:hypothetical protein
MNVRLFFAWHDAWIGAYYDRSEGVLYVCPLPCVVLMFSRSRSAQEKDAT